MINGDMRVYKSVDFVDKDEPRGYIEYPEEFLHSLNDGGMPPHELKVKDDMPLILLRNLRPTEGLCNGTRLKVRKRHNRLLECEILSGLMKGKIVFIPIITCTTETGRFPF